MMARQRTKRRIELGWFEAVVLAIGYVASLGMVGLTGFVIGQRAVPESLEKQERLLRLPLSASGRGTERHLGRGEPEMTFYEELLDKGEPVREGRIIVPKEEPKERPKKVPETTQAPRAKPLETKTSPTAADVKPPGPVRQTRSGAPEMPLPTPGDSGPRVTAEAQATARRAVQEAAPAAAAPRPQGPVSGPGDPQSAASSRLPSPPPGVSPEAAATAREIAGMQQPAAPAGASTGTWSVQVNATQEEALARNLARALRERGYDAFVIEQSREGVTWYRVRVGRLKSIEMANALVSKLKETEDLPQAFVASD